MATRSDVLEAIDKADERWFQNYQRERNSKTVNDTIKHIENAGKDGARQDGHRPKASRTTYHKNCWNCGHPQPRSFDASGVLLKRQHFVPVPDDPNVDETAPKCESCGCLPFIPKAESAPLVGTSFSPYFDLSGGQNWRLPPGCYYVKGQGTYIPTRHHLRDWAKMNGKDLR